MRHGGDVYQKEIKYDFSVSLNPFLEEEGLMDGLINAGIRGLKASHNYPDIHQRRIRGIIAKHEGVTVNEILAGNGASELLMGTIKYINPQSAMLMRPCYSGYEYALESLKGCELIDYPIKEENGFLPSLSDLDLIFEKKPELIFLTDPWNPVGKNIPDDFMEEFLRRAEENDIWVIIDESFLLLSEKALRLKAGRKKDLIKRFPHVVFITSYTKFLALPGVRMGYMTADEQVIEGVRSELPEWNISIPAESIMEEGIKLAEDSYIEMLIKKLREEREHLTRELQNLGFKVYDSDSCFIFFSEEFISKEYFSEENIPEEKDGIESLEKTLEDEGILIRSFEMNEYPNTPSKRFYRIGIKEHDANYHLVEMIQNMKIKK